MINRSQLSILLHKLQQSLQTQMHQILRSLTTYSIKLAITGIITVSMALQIHLQKNLVSSRHIHLSEKS